MWPERSLLVANRDRRAGNVNLRLIYLVVVRSYAPLSLYDRKRPGNLQTIPIPLSTALAKLFRPALPTAKAVNLEGCRFCALCVLKSCAVSSLLVRRTISEAPESQLYLCTY